MRNINKLFLYGGIKVNEQALFLMCRVRQCEVSRKRSLGKCISLMEQVVGNRITLVMHFEGIAPY